MTDTTVSGGEFLVSACFKKSLSAFFSNFISFNLLGLLIMVPGFLVIALLFGAAFAGTTLLNPGTGPESFVFGVFQFAVALGGWVLLISLQYLLTAVIVYGTLQYLQGKRPGFLPPLLQGFRRLFPIAGVAVITSILFLIGFVLLIVPGVVIALMLCVAIPVVMVERPGVLAALSRSRELTKGSRWPLFGLFLVTMLFITVVQFVVAVPLDSLLFSDALTFTIGVTAGAIIGAIASLAVQLFTTVFIAVVIGVAYHDLRVAKEGVSTEQIASVFD